MRVGMLGKQHLLALADKQLPELGIDSITQEHIKFEMGSVSGSGSGSGSSQVTSSGGHSCSGGVVDNRSALASMQAHARDESGAGEAFACTAPGPGGGADSRTRTKHNPVPAVPRRDEGAALTWLQLVSSMESTRS